MIGNAVKITNVKGKKKLMAIRELTLDEDKIHHGDLFKMYVLWEGGEGERIPAWAQRVVQDEETKIFSAQVWCPKKKYHLET